MVRRKHVVYKLIFVTTWLIFILLSVGNSNSFFNRKQSESISSSSSPDFYNYEDFEDTKEDFNPKDFEDIKDFKSKDPFYNAAKDFYDQAKDPLYKDLSYNDIVNGSPTTRVSSQGSSTTTAYTKSTSYYTENDKYFVKTTPVPPRVTTPSQSYQEESSADDDDLLDDVYPTAVDYGGYPEYLDYADIYSQGE